MKRTLLPSELSAGRTSPSLRIFMLLVSSLLLVLLSQPAEAAVSCNETSTCERLLRPGSVCLLPDDDNDGSPSTNGVCSNPFASGCLRNYLGEDIFPHRRICSSLDDDDDADGETCSNLSPVLEEHYNELRILYQDWDGAFMTSWVMQIFLSEVVRVPVSLEASTSERSRVANFYNPTNEFGYGGKSYDYDALRRAKDIEDCRLVNTDPDGEYLSCAHVMPEAWNGQKAVYIEAEREGLVEPVEGAGGVAKYSWYIPRFVAERDPTLLSHFGLRATPKTRRKLASTFLRPTTWAQYCNFMSPSNCTNPNEPENFILVDHSLPNWGDYGDEATTYINTTLTTVRIASRPPMDEEEGERFFVDGLFNGYFRHTQDSDCDASPNTCTGHISDNVCSWSTYVVPQAYYNDIPVKSDGPDVNGGYPFLRMLEIYQASNATKSPVLFYWFTPDPMLQSFLGTNAEFQEVLLPAPTQACVDARTTQEQRCSPDPTFQLGSPLGACDSEPHSYQKLIVSNLYQETTGSKKHAALINPSYEAIKRFRISDLQLAAIFDLWYSRDVDRWGYDPRQAVCQWVAENLDDLERYIPRSFPRKTVEAQEAVRAVARDPVHQTAMAIGVLSCALVVATSVAVFYWKDSTVFQYAQVEFVFFILAGLFLVSVGAILGALNPTTASCVATSWLILLGFTLELVPLIVKVAAIHRLVAASRQMRRIKLRRSHLMRTVALIVLLVVIYLVCLTILDPPTQQKELALQDTEVPDDDGFYVLEVSHYCAPDADVWVYIQMGWQVLLLFLAVILAVQTRHITSEFNESKRLGILVYSHTVFLVLRVIILALWETVPKSRLQGFQSLVNSSDTIFAVVIYFLPMFLSLAVKGQNHSRRTIHVATYSHHFDLGALMENVVQQISGASEVVAGALPEALVDYVDDEDEDDDDLSDSFRNENRNKLKERRDEAPTGGCRNQKRRGSREFSKPSIGSGTSTDRMSSVAEEDQSEVESF